MGSRAGLGWLGVTYVVEDGGVGVLGGGHGRGAAVGILQVEEEGPRLMALRISVDPLDAAIMAAVLPAICGRKTRGW